MKLEETLKEEQKQFKKNFDTKSRELQELQETGVKNTRILEGKLNSAHDKNKELKNKIQ